MPPRRATRADLDAVIATLVASHLDYAWEVWALHDPDRPDLRLRLEGLVRVDITLMAFPFAEIWMHDDAASVAVWHPPDAPTPGPETTSVVRAEARSAFGSRAAIVDSVSTIVRAHRPRIPHWFLGTIGTRPERQRRGLGAAVLQPVLERLDHSGAAAYLETSAPGNVAFYGSLGFEVVAHLDRLPSGAPETWVMWRDPRPA